MSYSAIPVDAARSLGDVHKKDIVLIVGWDEQSAKTNIVTWGRLPPQKSSAAFAGERIAKLLGIDGQPSETHEDYRREGEAAAAVDRLVRAGRAAEHAIRSVLAIRDGMTDEALSDVADAMRKALEHAGTMPAESSRDAVGEETSSEARPLKQHGP